MDKYLSIIIPIYNSSAFIAKCIESIINQSYKNFELILINDGSTDNSKEICLSYASNDIRIQYFEQTNRGVSSARNLGLEKSSGKYVLFIDSDDYITPEYIQTFINTASGKDSILIIQNYLYEGKESGNFPQFYCKDLDIISTLLKNKIFRFTGPHAKLFCLKTIHQFNINFPEGIQIGEDGIFLTRYLKYTNEVIGTEDKGYVIVSRNNSIQSKHHGFINEWNGYKTWSKDLNETFKLYNIPNIDSEVWKIVRPLFYRSINNLLEYNISTAAKLFKNKVSNFDIYLMTKYEINNKIATRIRNKLISTRQIYLLYIFQKIYLFFISKK